MSKKMKTAESTKTSSSHETPIQAVPDALGSREYLPISAISIDNEFKLLIPPLPEDERNMLAESVLLHGQLSPVLIWRTEGKVMLLDGHNRIELATGLNKNGQDDPAVEVKELAFETRAEALGFIIKNQLSRRNLRPDVLALLRGKLYLRQKRDPRENLKQNRTAAEDGASKGQSVLSKPTAEAIAQEAGVSAKTVKRDADFAAAADKLGITADIISGLETRSRKEIVKKANPDQKSPVKAEETLENRFERSWDKLTARFPEHLAEFSEWVIATGKIDPKAMASEGLADSGFFRIADAVTDSEQPERVPDEASLDRDGAEDLPGGDNVERGADVREANDQQAEVPEPSPSTGKIQSDSAASAFRRLAKKAAECDQKLPVILRKAIKRSRLIDEDRKVLAEIHEVIREVLAISGTRFDQEGSTPADEEELQWQNEPARPRS